MADGESMPEGNSWVGGSNRWVTPGLSCRREKRQGLVKWAGKLRERFQRETMCNTKRGAGSHVIRGGISKDIGEGKCQIVCAGENEWLNPGGPGPPFTACGRRVVL